MTAGEIEKAKLQANYWNGLAITTMAIGALPFFVGMNTGLPAVVVAFGPWGWILVATGTFFAWSLSRFFHTLALKAVAGI